MITVPNSEELKDISTRIKVRFLTMYKNTNAGHIGSSLSCAEILTFIFFGWMDDSEDIILSKGHAAAALYSTIAEKKWLTNEEISTFYQNGTYLAAHPPGNKIKKIPFATGSLGHGLSLAAGLGMANKLKNTHKKTFCITSDGELNEGSIWEAVMFIAHHKLKNVIWFIDKNNFQGFGTTDEVINMTSLPQKLQAFGFETIEINGHLFDDFFEAKKQLNIAQKPLVIICNTIKGKDWIPYENTLDSHYISFKENQYEETIAKLTAEP